MRQCRVVHREKGHAFDVVNEHRQSVVVKQQTKRFFLLLLLRDVLKSRDPSAIGHRPIDDAQDPTIEALNDSRNGLAFGNVFEKAGVELLGIAGKIAMRLVILQPIKQRAATGDEFRRVTRNLQVTLIMEDGKPVGVEHAQALRHIIERGVELKLLGAQQFRGALAIEQMLIQLLDHEGDGPVRSPPVALHLLVSGPDQIAKLGEIDPTGGGCCLG